MATSFDTRVADIAVLDLGHVCTDSPPCDVCSDESVVYAVFSCTPDGHKLPLCVFHRDKFKQADTWAVESGEYWWTCNSTTSAWSS